MADDERTPDEQFAILVNKLMVKGIQDGADTTAMAKIFINTARELFEHYGAGEESETFLEFVVSTEFDVEEIEAWLDERDESDAPDE